MPAQGAVSPLNMYLSLAGVGAAYLFLNPGGSYWLTMPAMMFTLAIGLRFSTAANWSQAFYCACLCVLSAYCVRGICAGITALAIPRYNFVADEDAYLTIGINGFIEGAESLGISIDSDDPDYIAYTEAVLRPIYEANKSARGKGILWNTEMVPAENLGVRNAAWDKTDNLFVPRDCYNSYFYVVEDPSVNVLDKLKLHGRAFTRYLDGGSACHINLDEHLTAEQYLLLLDAAIKTGCNYLTINVPNTLCRACGHISKHRLIVCPSCGGTDLDYATRIIGYLKLVSRFAAERQEEEHRRHYGEGQEIKP